MTEKLPFLLDNNNCGNSNTVPELYCAQYNYPSGSIGYGCAAHASYTKTVALSTNTSNQGGPLTGVGMSSTTTTSVSSSSSQSPSPSQTPTAADQHSTHFSSGAIAGIAIGCAVAIITVIILAIIIILQRRKARNLQASLEHRSDPAYPWPVFVQPQVGSSPQMSHQDSSDLPHRTNVVAPRVYSVDSTAYELDVRERDTPDQNKRRTTATETEET